MRNPVHCGLSILCKVTWLISRKLGYKARQCGLQSLIICLLAFGWGSRGKGTLRRGATHEGGGGWVKVGTGLELAFLSWEKQHEVKVERVWVPALTVVKPLGLEPCHRFEPVVEKTNRQEIGKKCDLI